MYNAALQRYESSSSKWLLSQNPYFELLLPQISLVFTAYIIAFTEYYFYSRKMWILWIKILRTSCQYSTMKMIWEKSQVSICLLTDCWKPQRLLVVLSLSVPPILDFEDHYSFHLHINVHYPGNVSKSYNSALKLFHLVVLHHTFFWNCTIQEKVKVFELNCFFGL